MERIGKKNFQVYQTTCQPKYCYGKTMKILWLNDCSFSKTNLFFNKLAIS